MNGDFSEKFEAAIEQLEGEEGPDAPLIDILRI